MHITGSREVAHALDLEWNECCSTSVVNLWIHVHKSPWDLYDQLALI